MTVPPDSLFGESDLVLDTAPQEGGGEIVYRPQCSHHVVIRQLPTNRIRVAELVRVREPEVSRTSATMCG